MGTHQRPTVRLPVIRIFKRHRDSNRNELVLVRRNDIDAVEGNEDPDTSISIWDALGYNVSFGRFSANISGDATYYGNTIVPVYTPRYGTGESPMMVQSFANDGSMFYGNAMLRLSAGLLGSSLQLQLYAEPPTTSTGAGFMREPDGTGEAGLPLRITSAVSRFPPDIPTPSVYHSSVSDQRYPSYYYLNGTWAWNGLYVGLFVQKSVPKNRLSAIPRAWTRETTSTTRHITIPPIVRTSS